MIKYLTAVFLKTGAMRVPNKLSNPTICGWGGPFTHNYEWNEPPQTQMVGFCNLAGTDIAPV